MNEDNIPTDARAYLRIAGKVPLGGLDLPLATAERDGIPDDDYLAVLTGVTCPPVHSVGINFMPPTAADTPCCLSDAVTKWLEGRFDAVPPPEPGRFVYDDYRALAAFMPTIDLPAGLDHYGWTSHFYLLTNYLSRGQMSFTCSPAWQEARRSSPDQRRRQTPLPSRQKHPNSRKITMRKVYDFVTSFPDLFDKIEFSADVGGMLYYCNKTSNFYTRPHESVDVVARLIGLRVDVRRGMLVSESAINHAFELAVAPIESMAESWSESSVEARLWNLFDAVLPRVVPCNATRYISGLRGAAWSCDVDAILNGIEIWRAIGQQGVWSLSHAAA